MAEKDLSQIKTEMDSYLNDGVPNFSVLPSLLNQTITDLLDSIPKRMISVEQPTVDLGTDNGIIDLDLSNANHFLLELDGNVTLGFTNEPQSDKGATYVLHVTQDVTGGHTLDLSAFETPSALTPIADGGSAYSQVWISWDGTRMVANVVADIL